MRKTKNKISTTRTADFFAIAAVSMIAANTTCDPQIIVDNSAEPRVNLVFQSTPTSTRFNDANRYSLDKLKHNKRVLRNLANLKSNWNGYGGESIDQDVIEKTEKMLSDLDYQPQIFPTGRGTIQIEYFKNDDNLIEIEISNEEIFVYKAQNGEEFEGSVEFDKLSEIITSFYA
ncbi:hypothetical protein FNH22_31415 [Fulvivirga sp. M361]|uniref:hypothetical protein n=1 Tax=Fulvivirga sp. M361 TaxID=2594266 RepID=UPI00117A5B73|nr:hypothetical protein [Fulvivirga sp. M361]TRX45785.1 hypothetical protein FNH22_31415 [Fulvivirga sp. M361]